MIVNGQVFKLVHLNLCNFNAVFQELKIKIVDLIGEENMHRTFKRAVQYTKQTKGLNGKKKKIKNECY